MELTTEQNKNGKMAFERPENVKESCRKIVPWKKYIEIKEWQMT